MQLTVIGKAVNDGAVGIRGAAMPLPPPFRELVPDNAALAGGRHNLEHPAGCVGDPVDCPRRRFDPAIPLLSPLRRRVGESKAVKSQEWKHVTDQNAEGWSSQFHYPHAVRITSRTSRGFTDLERAPDQGYLAGSRVDFEDALGIAWHPVDAAVVPQIPAVPQPVPLHLGQVPANRGHRLHDGLQSRR